ncbi:MAG: TOBE domain-containing protein, partial [Aquihabitans sp.]
LMDEPLSNLDAKLRANTRIELVELHKRVGTTIVYVTHDQVEAMTMATRVAVMTMGKLQQVGTPQEIYGQPINTFVAQFIGTPPMNCLTGTIAPDGDGVMVGEQRFPLPATLNTKVKAGQPIVVGVRPEHLDVAPHGGVTVEVRAVEWLGHECLVSASIGGESLIIRQVGMSANEAGSHLRVSIEPEHVHLFDVDTTERLA